MRRFQPISFFCAVFALTLASPAICKTAEIPDAPKKEISDQVSNQLSKLKDKIDVKDYEGAIKILNDALGSAGPNTYDLAMVSQIKAQILLTEGKYAEAIPSLLTAQDLGARYQFFDQHAQLERLYLLAQIHYQLAADSKDPRRQDELFTEAYRYVSAWIAANPRPAADGRLFASSILYAHATIDINKPNLPLVKEAVSEAREGLYLSIKPSDQNYLLLLAGLQQLGDQAGSAEVLELLVARDPTKPLYWQQLASSYLTQAGEATDPHKARHLQLRTIITLQRAQEHGVMNGPKDYLNIVSLYFNLEQYGKAAELLSTGLASKQIENTRANWELLSLAYQQSGSDNLAIDSLLKATQLFPAEGQLELSLSQLYYSDGRTQDAFDHLQRAAAKGNLKKPGAAYLFLGLTAYELQKYEDALKWAGAAAHEADVKPEDAKRLARAATDALRERAVPPVARS